MLFDQVADVHAFDELEDDVVHAAVFADVVHAGDVVVVEPGGRLGPRCESGAASSSSADWSRESTLTATSRLSVVSSAAKHGAHAAAADELLQQKLAQPLAFQQAARLKRGVPEGGVTPPRGRAEMIVMLGSSGPFDPPPVEAATSSALEASWN